VLSPQSRDTSSSMKKYAADALGTFALVSRVAAEFTGVLIASAFTQFEFFRLTLRAEYQRLFGAHGFDR
jgi:hypothetical protein